MANADYLPFNFNKLHKTIDTYANEVMQLANDRRKAIKNENEMISEGTYKAYFDPKKTFIIPETQEEVPYFNFSPLQNELVKMEEIVAKVSTNLNTNGFGNAEINKLLFTSERKLTREEGLPIRPWYKHHLYAPGFYTGYGVKTLPGIREAIEQGKWDLVEQQIKVLADVLTGFNDHLEEITKQLD